MKKLSYYFLVLLAAVWVGLKIAADPGYLLVAYQKVTVEMPLWLAVIGILVVFFLLYYLVRLVSNIRLLGARLRAWSRQRRVKRAWQRTHRGLVALAAGEWSLAERDLLRAAPSMDNKVINYLAAARAAQAQGALIRRDEYLRKTEVKGRLPELALGLTQAHLQVRRHQIEQALATLQRLQQIAPKHKPVLQLLKQTYLQLKDWCSLEILLPKLEKYNVLTEKHFLTLEKKVYRGLLEEAIEREDDSIALIWQRVPKRLRDLPVLVQYYARYLIRKEPQEAESMLRNVLQKQFDDHLVYLYGLIENIQTDKSLQAAERWLECHEKNAMLLLTLGRLCLRNQLWGKARSYFEASLGVLPQTETYHELAKLLEQLGEMDKALTYYRQGLTFAAEQGKEGFRVATDIS